MTTTASVSHSLRLEIAHRVRDACEVHFGARGKRAIKLAGKCHAINGALVLAFRAAGIPARPVAGYFIGGPTLTDELRRQHHKGWGHCWVASGRWYWDLAARQFGREYPRVMVAPKSSPHFFVPTFEECWHIEIEQQLVAKATQGPYGQLYVQARRILDAAGIALERED